MVWKSDEFEGWEVLKSTVCGEIQKGSNEIRLLRYR